MSADDQTRPRTGGAAAQQAIQPAEQPSIRVAFGAASDTGLRRRENEDAYLAASPLFLVADGMGGHQAGEVASAAVVDAFASLVGRASLTIDDVSDAVARASRRIAELPAVSAGAGTTLTGVVIADVGGEGYWLVVNLGDSRTYRRSDGVLEQISVDHSVVQELIDSGELDAAAAGSDSRRNVITRAIGAGSDSHPDFWLIPAEQGDRIMVCSDGLTGELDDARIDSILRAESDPQAAATRLVHEALVLGGRDNVTVLVIDATLVGSRSGGAGSDAGDLDDTLPTGADAGRIDSDTRPRPGPRTEGER